jgi:chromosome condensin MukBEF MukE localization factor
MVYEEGRPITLNSTSNLVRIVRKVQENSDLSKRIMQAAIEASLPKKRSATVVEVIDVDAAESSDFELEDNELYVAAGFRRKYPLNISMLRCAADASAMCDTSTP